MSYMNPNWLFGSTGGLGGMSQQPMSPVSPTNSFGDFFNQPLDEMIGQHYFGTNFGLGGKYGSGFVNQGMSQYKDMSNYANMFNLAQMMGDPHKEQKEDNSKPWKFNYNLPQLNYLRHLTGGS